MKFAVLALIASVCLVAVTAKITGDLVTNQEDIDQYDRSIVKRIKCFFLEVKKIKHVVENFVQDITACGDEVSGGAKELVEAVEEIKKRVKEIIHIYQTDCDNGNSIGLKCTTKILEKVPKLVKKVKHAINLIKDIKDVPGSVGDCILEAILALGEYFSNFLANIKECSS